MNTKMIRVDNGKKKMETGDHFKNGASSKNLMSCGIFILACLLLPIRLSAQITFAEKRELPQQKYGWDYLRDDMMSPYDSSTIYFDKYPLLQAYKKYIGQQIFFKKGTKVYPRSSGYGSTEISKVDEAVDLGHKYFEIIDVISIAKSQLKYGYAMTYYYKRENDSEEKLINYTVENDSVPCFIIKDIQTYDTLEFVPFGRFKEDYILVGGFVDLKNRMVGQKLVYFSGFSDKEILHEWKCIDVSIADDGFIYAGYTELKINDKKEYKEHVAIVLQKTKDTSVVGNIFYSAPESNSGAGNIVYFARTLKGLSNLHYGMTLEKTYQTYQKIRNQEKAQNQQARAKYQQQLISKYGATAAKQIMDGKLEIGQNKAICREIANEVTVTEKTATTEKWKVSTFWGEYNLYFSGDKLVRIVYR